MKTKLIYFLTIVFAVTCTSLQGQDCVKCDTNSTNSGDFATALGDSTSASGLASFASGHLTRADGNWSAAFGRNTIASGVFSFAGGENSISEGYRSFSFGRSVYATGTNSFATGTETESSGHSSFAAGKETKAMGDYSFASGFRSEAIEMYTAAIGFYSLATSSAAISIGSTVRSNAHRSIVMGSGGPWNEEVFLENNIPRSFMVGFSSTLPTLFVNESPSSAYFDRTGRVAIGNMTDPRAKLHIYSDDNEAATLFLEPSNWNTDYNAQIWLGNQQHGISAEVEKGLVYQTEENHVFRGGDVFIEDIGKGIIMKSPDGKCWRGTVDNSGSLNFILLETCPGSPNAIFESGTSGSNDGLKVYPNPANDYLNIEMINPQQKAFTISLLDEKGVELLSKQIHSQKTQIYTGDLKSGIYFVRVSGNGRQLVEKVIRQ